MSEFKDIIFELRKEKGLSQKQLSIELNVSMSTVAMWETGKRRPSTELYEVLADYFKVDLEYLYGRSDIRRKYQTRKDGVEVRFTSADEFFLKKEELDSFTSKGGRIYLANDDKPRIEKISSFINLYNELKEEDKDLVFKIIKIERSERNA